jgi:hypothetical protein
MASNDKVHTPDDDGRMRRAKQVARRIVRLTSDLAAARTELTDLLGPNERVAVEGAGTFQKVPTGWRPDRAFTQWLEKNRLIKKVTEMRPVVSMRLVNAAAGKTPALLTYVTLARTAAAERYALRFKVEGEPDSDGDETV